MIIFEIITTGSQPPLSLDIKSLPKTQLLVMLELKNKIKIIWRNKKFSWHPLNKHAMNICLSSLRIGAHLSWRTGKHLHVLHVLRTYSTCSHPELTEDHVQSHKNPVSASAMLTGKFLQIRKVFATSSLLAEEFSDTLQYKISR